MSLKSKDKVSWSFHVPETLLTPGSPPLKSRTKISVQVQVRPMTIRLSKANAIIRGALKKGAELDLNPLTVVVLDAGGHMVAMQRSDGAAMLRPQIAQGKAFGALALGMGSASLEAAFKDRGSWERKAFCARASTYYMAGRKYSIHVQNTLIQYM